MKQAIFKLSFLFIIVAWFCSCNGQSSAVEQAKQTRDAIKKMMPGGIATSENGWMMKAKIDGKNWEATSMMPPDRAGRIMGDNNGESVSLPYYDRRNFLAVTKRKLGEGNNAVDMMLNDDVKIWGAKSGVMEITKVDDDWIEGTFSFIAGGLQSDKTVEVTDGFFRISLANKK